jgi:hypothetical protein
VKFIHDDAAFFEAALGQAAAQCGVDVALVEKDYWITHVLWSLHHQGFELWFKGGTSLSKGYGLIQRFSEDIDLKLAPGRVTGLPMVNWKSDKKGAVAARRDYYAKLAACLDIPGTQVVLCGSGPDTPERNPGFNRDAFDAELEVRYPGFHIEKLPGMMRPFVLLELGTARVLPCLERTVSSWVHDAVASLPGNAQRFVDTRVLGIRCVHPLVTLLEKLDAVGRRFPRPETSAEKFVRHYEDIGRLALATRQLPPLEGFDDARGLAEEMLGQRQLKRMPAPADEAFNPVAGPRWEEIREAYAANAGFHWGTRLSLEESCELARGWMDRYLVQGLGLDKGGGA